MSAKEAVELGFADHIGAVRLNPVFMYDVDFKLQVPPETQEIEVSPEEFEDYLKSTEETPKKKKKSKKGKKK